MRMSFPLAARRAGLLVVMLFGVLLQAANAAELVMFERAGCSWCRNWDREIAAIYPKTQEGAKAPLRRVSLDKPLAPEWKLDPPVFYTPTFVVIDKGREIGRITGYSNPESFWGLLGAILARPGQTPTP
jgi:thioredoxin-related protein